MNQACQWGIKFFLFVCSGVFLSCSRPSSGYAPSIPGTEVLPPSSLTTQISTSQKNILNSGWTVDADVSTTAQNQTLSNGWKIEVIYE